MDSLTSKIVTISCLQELDKSISNFDSDSLFIYDIDNTLLTYNYPIMRDNNRDIRDSYLKFIKKYFGSEYVDFIWNKTNASTILLEPYALAKLLKTIKNRVIAVTARRTGIPSPLVKINAEDIIIDIIKKFNIPFGLPQSPNNISIQIESNISKIEHNLTDFHNAGSPLYKDGILFTCNSNKGTVLKSFFKQIGYIPSKIFFIDDKMENLYDVRDWCFNTGINFYGFHYTYSNKLNNMIPSNIKKILNTDNPTKQDLNIIQQIFDKQEQLI